MRFILSAVLLLTASSVYAQCPGGVCPIRGYASQGYASRGYARAYVAPKYACAPVETIQPCAPVEPCAPIETVEPCAPVETIQPCDPVATCAPVETVEPCAPVETIQPCAPVETCAPVQTFPEAVTVSECVGVCPIRRTASTVSSLLTRLNAVRARYGLTALKFDATLEAGAQRQAAYCSQTGALIHGNAAEILAQNGSGFDVALDQWLASPAHRALLLGRYTSAGVGVRIDSRGRAWCAVRFR